MRHACVIIEPGVIFKRQASRHEFERRHDMSRRGRGAVGGIRKRITHCGHRIGSGQNVGKIEGFHHLPHKRIGQNDGWSAVSKCRVKRKGSHVEHLAHRIRRKHRHAKIAVTAIYGHGHIPLFGTNVAQPRTRSHDVDNDPGDARSRHVGNPFLHQTEPRTRGGRHRGHTGRPGPIQHIYRRHLAFGL